MRHPAPQHGLREGAGGRRRRCWREDRLSAALASSPSSPARCSTTWEWPCRTRSRILGRDAPSVTTSASSRTASATFPCTSPGAARRRSTASTTLVPAEQGHRAAVHSARPQGGRHQPHAAQPEVPALRSAAPGSDELPERRKGGIRGLWAGRMQSRGMSLSTAGVDESSGTGGQQAR